MASKHAEVRLYAGLAELATAATEQGRSRITFDVEGAVKDAVESLGIPHTEVGLVLVNGTSVAFDAPVRDGDRVAAYPPFHRLDVAAVSHVAPPPLDEPRFVLDVHLGALARRLRILGFDTRYRTDLADEELARISAGEDRILVTRDRTLLMRSTVRHGHLARSDDPDEQLREVAARFDLADRVRPFVRCPLCNGLLEDVDKAEVADTLEPGTRAHYQRFRRCVRCDQVYWRGAHHDRLMSLVEETRGRPARPGRSGHRR